MNDAVRQAFDKAATTGLLADASPPLLDTFRTIAVPVHLADGEILFEQGQAGDALYVVEAGTVEISVVSRDGRKLALDVFRSGDVFGEIALFDGGQRTATVTAMEPCTLRAVRRHVATGARGPGPEQQQHAVTASEEHEQALLLTVALETEALRKVLEQRTGKKVRIRIEVEPELIGGVVVRIGDRVYDGSVQHQLDSLREQLEERAYLSN